MPFQWKDFLAVAQRLAKETDDASRRTAIGRAYYSIFNVALEQAQKVTGDYSFKPQAHAWCWERYSQSTDMACKRLGVLGERMKRERVKADYRAADIKRIDDDVQRALEGAEVFFETFSKLDPTHPHP
jgi:hypothetical protein